MGQIWIGKLLFIFLGVAVIMKAVRLTKEKHCVSDYTSGCMVDSLPGCLISLLFNLLLTRLPWRIMQVVLILFGILLIVVGIRITSS